MKRKVKDFRRLRHHYKRYHRRRTLSRRRKAFVRFMKKWFGWLRVLRYLNPLRYLKRLDRYIINKFIGTYIYSIILIISIAIVFDVNENLAKFSTYGAPLEAIVFDYYANFVPYFSNLFSPLFVFIAVIFFTSKLAGNSEIIAMLAAGVSFKRLMRPYMISAALIAVVNLVLGAYVIPKGTIVRQDFEAKYKNSKKTLSASNVQLMVGPGIIAYMQQYDDRSKTAYGFSLDKFENKKLVSHMTASLIRYDSISDTRYHWKAQNYKIRTLKGLKEEIQSGASIDTLIMMEPMDLVFSQGQQETLTSPELLQYISKQIDRRLVCWIERIHPVTFACCRVKAVLVLQPSCAVYIETRVIRTYLYIFDAVFPEQPDRAIYKALAIDL